MGRYLEFLCVLAGREFLHAGSEPADGADCFFKGLLQPVDLFLLTDKTSSSSRSFSDRK